MIPQQCTLDVSVVTSFFNFIFQKNEKERDEKEEAKRAYMENVKQKADVSHLLINDLRMKIHKLYSRICKLEALKYDLEKRHERQLYDVNSANNYNFRISG